MNVKQFVWGLLLCLLPIMVCAEKISGLAWDAILYDQPNTSSVKLQKLYAGDVVVILEPERPDFLGESTDPKRQHGVCGFGGT